MEYFLLILSALSFSMQIIFTKLFEKKNGDGIKISACFSFVSGLVSIIIILIINSFKVDFSLFTFLMGLAIGAECVIASILSIKAMVFGTVAVATMFFMLGGTVIPSFIGLVFLNESMSINTIIATVIIIFALMLPVFDKTQGEKTGGSSKNRKLIFILLCIGLFFANGANSAICELHQTFGKGFEDVNNFSSVFFYSNNFLFWMYLFQMLFAGLVLLFSPKKETLKITIQKNTVISGTGFAVVNILGTVLQLYCALLVNASIMFPFITGGTIIFTTVLSSIFYKEKINRYIIVENVLLLGASILFVL